jgi:hypothetical protein
MKTKTTMVWLELIGGLLAWVWIIASLAFVYLLAVALFGSSPWSRVAWAFGVGAIAKWLARGFNDHKIRVAFTAELVAKGYTPEAAGEEWYARYTGQVRQTNVAPAPMTRDESLKIINTYGRVLAEHKSSCGDLSELPYPKERIKEAILFGIQHTADLNVREQLKGAYITLAQWQTGFGARRANAEMTPDDLKGTPSEIAARILAKGDELVKVPHEIAAEAELLMANLKALGLSSQSINQNPVAVRPTAGTAR